ncbi:MAG: aminoacetone oxidase family FAD-binding enzyme, partial [Oscillospiraceae bacterium]|nr:aminoacetone oxidase family FAD-binding enzyme [Oscillospiraceae bacterium]
IRPPQASLVPLLSPDPYCAALQGLTLRNIALRMFDHSGRLLYTDFGEILFTHFGLSGPMALSASAFLRGGGPWRVLLDLKPALDGKKLDARLLRDFDRYRNRDLRNALGDLLPRTMIPVVVSLSGIPPEKKVHDLTKADRAGLLSLCKGFPVAVTGPGDLRDAVVTSGGVSVAEINPATMASRLLGGLYFAGEVIDTDALTGGFNLQIAWSTGQAAGRNV